MNFPSLQVYPTHQRPSVTNSPDTTDVQIKRVSRAVDGVELVLHKGHVVAENEHAPCQVARLGAHLLQEGATLSLLILASAAWLPSK